MLKRLVTKYAFDPPHHQVSEQEISCSPDDMRHLFDVNDEDEGMPDIDMIWCYEINSPEQIAFFKAQGVSIEGDGFYYVECYEE